MFRGLSIGTRRSSRSWRARSINCSATCKVSNRAPARRVCVVWRTFSRSASAMTSSAAARPWNYSTRMTRFLSPTPTKPIPRDLIYGHDSISLISIERCSKKGRDSEWKPDSFRLSFRRLAFGSSEKCQSTVTVHIHRSVDLFCVCQRQQDGQQ